MDKYDDHVEEPCNCFPEGCQCEDCRCECICRFKDDVVEVEILEPKTKMV
jgi:hypothetical protein